MAERDNPRVQEIVSDGTITTVAGNGTEGYSGDGGSAICAQLAWPRGVAVGADGSLFVADCGNFVIRKITPGGAISTVAGTGTCGYSGDGGSATSAQLDDPHGVAVDVDGSLYIGEPHNHCIRKVWGLHEP